PGVHDGASVPGRAVAAGPDHRVHVAEPGGAGAADADRHHRRPAHRVELPHGGPRPGPAGRTGRGEAAAGGGGRGRPGPGARPGGRGAAAVPGGAGAVRAGRGDSLDPVRRRRVTALAGEGRVRSGGITALPGCLGRFTVGPPGRPPSRADSPGRFPRTGGRVVHSPGAVHSAQRVRPGSGSLALAAVAAGCAAVAPDTAVREGPVRVSAGRRQRCRAREGDAMNETMVCAVGNVATSPVYRELASGPSVRFRLAVTARYWDREKGMWTDGHTNFFTVWANRQLATNAAASLSLGEPVVVQGRLKVRTEQRDGQQGRVSADIDAVTIGHDLARGTSAFRRSGRPEQPGATAVPERPEPNWETSPDAAAGPTAPVGNPG